MAHPYDRTAAGLMVEAAAQLDYPTSRGEVVQWFAEHYPQVKASTIRAHIVGLTANDRSRHHYPSLARREPLFARHPDGSLGAFEDHDEDESEHLDVAATPRLEFALEAFLEEFILTNWEGIDWGRPLELWESETDELGHQLATPVGRLDFLCRDTATDALVVVELKRGRPSAKPPGTWGGWVLAAENQRVEGIIVAHEQDLRLAYAVAAVPGLSILTYSERRFHAFACLPAGRLAVGLGRQPTRPQGTAGCPGRREAVQQHRGICCGRRTAAQHLCASAASPILGPLPDTEACESSFPCPPSKPRWPAYAQPSASAEPRSKISFDSERSAAMSSSATSAN